MPLPNQTKPDPEEWKKVKLFTPDPGDKFSAEVNFAGQYELGGRATGYSIAAEVLFARLAEDDSDIAYLVHPFIFLCRHALELRLKEIIRNGYRLQGFPKDFRFEHELSKLWEKARPIITTLEEDVAEWELQGLDHVISEFATVDDGSFTFRYTEDKKGKNTLDGHYSINLRVFYTVFTAMFSILDRIACSFEDRDYELSDLNS